ncbi:MAG: hypoxanthine phosphoribosyltransferase [Planctomycetes bacterium]|nr:hypoxanthine phosphoribosyltransferase [Planctomycetota bacterium]
MTDTIAPILSADDIQRRVRDLAGQIDRDYEGSPLTLIGVLNGSFIFLSDLVRNLKTQCVIDFVAAASYGDGTTPGDLKLLKTPTVDIEGRRVLIVDDILDTGRTLALIRDVLREQKPSDLRICVFLSKQCERQADIHADYIGFDVPDQFVVGYGLDHAGRYRQLGYVGVIPQRS